jgi:hypothetical protein
MLERITLPLITYFDGYLYEPERRHELTAEILTMY